MSPWVVLGLGSSSTAIGPQSVSAKQTPAASLWPKVRVERPRSPSPPRLLLLSAFQTQEDHLLSDTPTMSSAPSTGAFPQPTNGETQMSRKFPRTRTGCLTCRRRKKKCDETKPKCEACTRNKIDCEWPPHIIRIFGLDPPNNRSEQEKRGREGTESSTSDDSSIAISPSSQDSLEVIERHDKDDADNKKDYAIIWSRGLNAFLSPRRAGMLLPASETLLAHYMELTGPLLATAPSQTAPFVSWVMPIAYNDDLLMHSVLALSGAHLSFRAETPEINQAIYQHYCLVLKTLRQVSQNEKLLKDPFVLLRVAMTLVMLCQYEVRLTTPIFFIPGNLPLLTVTGQYRSSPGTWMDLSSCIFVQVATLFSSSGTSATNSRPKGNGSFMDS